MDYEEFIHNNNIKERLDSIMLGITEIRENIHSLNSYTLHGKLSIVKHSIEQILEDIENESWERK